MATDPNAQLRGALTGFLWDACGLAVEIDAHPTKNSKKQYRLNVNRRAERLLKAIRAAMREQVRDLPGRAQKGAVDAALRSVTPKIAKALRA